MFEQDKDIEVVGRNRFEKEGGTDGFADSAFADHAGFAEGVDFGESVFHGVVRTCGAGVLLITRSDDGPLANGYVRKAYCETIAALAFSWPDFSK